MNRETEREKHLMPHAPEGGSVRYGEESYACILGRLEYPSFHINTDCTGTLIQQSKLGPWGERKRRGRKMKKMRVCACVCEGETKTVKRK